MTTAAITAYDIAERVSGYDDAMDLMHPRRRRMAEIMIEVLPYAANAPLRVLELGSGAGFLTGRILEAFTCCEVVALDGAAAMHDLARQRLKGYGDRVRFVTADMRTLRSLKFPQPFDMIVSAYALHHLDGVDKYEVVRSAWRTLAPGGWFLNGDLIKSRHERIESRFQELRVAGIVERAQASSDPRFMDAGMTRRFLDALEQGEGDQPLTLTSDMEILRRAGIRSATVFWAEYREAVTGGCK